AAQRTGRRWNLPRAADQATDHAADKCTNGDTDRATCSAHHCAALRPGPSAAGASRGFGDGFCGQVE
ncbi:hypothetical protein, partial [uncultured Thiodictyon sp.]|uniref:hypothetical protein n=1 Tax=uncultured Thiodictyon sp. TaxID=1846217 RepID=UPI0025EE0F10